MEALAAVGMDSVRLHLAKMVPVGDQLVKIVVDLHMRGVIHHDIKPANILIQPDTCKITVSEATNVGK
jgi:serine/threonine protein kinase